MTRIWLQVLYIRIQLPVHYDNGIQYHPHIFQKKLQDDVFTSIEAIMQEKICQNWSDDTDLGNITTLSTRLLSAF
jgi:hypothetical protein